MPQTIRPALCPLLGAVISFSLTAAACAPLPYALNFAQDNIVGIDVALESDVAFADSPGAARSRITLARHFVRGSEVHELSAAIGTVMASTNLANLRLMPTGTRVETSRNGATSTALVLNPSQELRRLEEHVLASLRIFRSNPIDAEEYIVTPDGSRMSEDTIDNVERFLADESGVNYRPFLLVAASQADAAKRLPVRPADAVTVRAVGVSIYQLGARGSADRLLWTWTGEPGAR
jgi:hypothetical protein